jgi:hypothetical protein
MRLVIFGYVHSYTVMILVKCTLIPFTGLIGRVGYKNVFRLKGACLGSTPLGCKIVSLVLRRNQ